MPESARRDQPVLFTGKTIYTGDPACPWAEAMAVQDGRILATGRIAELEHRFGVDVERVELDGAMVMPGIIDIHNHVLEGARAQLIELQLGPELDFAQILERVAVAEDRDGWVIGGPFVLKRCPEMEDAQARIRLDAVSRGRPVMLRDVSLHARFANSAALMAAGIGRETPDPPDGRYVRDGNGDLTGLIYESAGNPLEAAAPPLTTQEWRACGERAVALLNAVGVTGFGLAIASGTTLTALKALDEAQALTAWAAGYMLMEPHLLAQERDLVGMALVARRDAFRSRHVHTDFAKFFMDGVPAMRTAAFLEPYLEPDGRDGDSRGHNSYTVEELAERIGRLDALGISVKVHAVGDRAVRDVLDAIARVRAAGGTGQRHSIAHMTFITPEDVSRLAPLGVVADLCPPMWFPTPNMQNVKGVLGADRVARSWPIRDIVDSGALAATGTDWPAIAPTPNPWPGLAALITRADPTGAVGGRHAPDQSLDLATALPLYTSNAARTLGLDRETGSLSPGKSADFITLDRDLFAIDPAAIAETQVLATYFEGRPVYRRSGLPSAAQ